MSNIPRNTNVNSRNIIPDTGEVVYNLLNDLRNYDYKENEKLEKAHAGKIAVIKYGPPASGKGTAYNQYLMR